MKTGMRLLAVLLLLCGQSFGQSKPNPDEIAIRNILKIQESDWNKGDIAGFMQGYWKNDSLTFTGASGITYGWENTYQGYLKRYNSPEKMGQLSFSLLEMLPLGNDYFKVIGKWHLKRTIGDVGGHFTLIFRRFADGWKIIADHTS